MARVYEKGQVTIPKSVRDVTGIEVGAQVVVEARDGEIVVRRPRGVLEFEPPRSSGRKAPWPKARRVARDERAALRAAEDI